MAELTLEEKIQKAKSMGVPEDLIMQRVKQKYPEYQSQSGDGILQGKAIPTIGALIGGGAGALLGGVPAVGGAGLGYAGGEILRRNLAQLTGTPIQTSSDPLEQVGEVAKESALSGLMQGVGGLAGKGIGALFRLGRLPTALVDKILARSPRVIDLNKFLLDAEEKIVPKMTEKTVGTEGTTAFWKLASDVEKAAKEMIPEGGSLSTLSKTSANQLKRNITGVIKKYYGSDTGKFDIETRKMLGNLLRKEVSKGEKGVEPLNKIASLLYGIPNLTEDIASALPGGTGVLARRLLNLPLGTLQSLFPVSGAQSRILIPTLLRLLTSPEEQRKKLE